MAAGDPGSLKRNYSAIAIETSLTASIPSQSAGSSYTSFTVASNSGFPTVPFTLILDPDTSKEEVVTVTAQVGSSTTYTIKRGEDNTTGLAHSAGATVRHGVSGRDFTEEQTHIAARGYDADSSILSNASQTHVHGLVSGDGSVVGSTQAVVLTRKTLGTGTSISGTVDNSAGTISGGTITGAVVTGLTTPTTSSQAAPKSYVDSILGSATAASSSATAAASSAAAAVTSANSASTSAASSLTSANSAAASVVSATAAASSATTSANSAAASAVAAASSAGTATTQAGLASGYATTASNSAATATTQATSAATSASSAYVSAASAAVSASQAATSASSASNAITTITGMTGSGLVRDMGSVTSADTTTTSYINISTIAANAATSATSAANSASAAATSATSASNSATISANSSTTSAASAAAAATSAASAATSAASALTSATSAAASVTSAIQKTIVTAKGDLIVGSASSTVANLAVGTDGYLLTASSTATNGITWAAAPVSLPSQSGNNGKYLTTNGSTASWASITTDPLPQVLMMMGA